MCLPVRLSLIGRLAPDHFLDLVQRTDMLQRLGVQGIRVCGVQFVELSPSMCPASCFGYPPGFVNRPISAVGIRLQRAVERFEMLLRMDALAVGRIGEPDGRRRHVTRVPVVAHVDPQPSGFRLAIARREHRHWRIVGMQFDGCHDVPA